jgi:hypothetical protein
MKERELIWTYYEEKIYWNDISQVYETNDQANVGHLQSPDLSAILNAIKTRHGAGD